MSGEGNSGVEQGTVDRMLMFNFPTGVRIDGKLAGTIATTLRKAVMSRVPDPLPPEVSGHGADDRAHVAYLPLIGDERSNAPGHVHGAAVLCPPANPGLVESLKKVLHAKSGFRLELPGATLHLSPPLSTTDNEWVAQSPVWTTVTPVVLDRFPGKGKEPAELARACQNAGLPEPTTIRTARNPFTRGAANLGRADLPRRERIPRPFTHAQITFDEPVSGPVLLGTQRYLGMGLFRPL